MTDIESVVKKVCSLDEAEWICTQAIRDGLVPILTGPNGIGKSALAKRIAREMSRFFNNGEMMDIVDVISGRPRKGQYGVGAFNCSGMDPEDFAMPMFGTSHDAYERRVTTALPGADDSWFQGGMTIDDIMATVVLEEIGKKPENFKIYSELFFERQLGTNYKVPPNVSFIGTTNRAEDGAGSHDLFNDIVNRSLILHIEATVEGFLKYHRGELNNLIFSIVKMFKDDFLFTQEEEEDGKPFASPRSIWAVSKMLKRGLHLSNPMTEPYMLGTIGQRATIQLFAAHRAWGKIHNIDAMIDDPDAHKDQIEQMKNDLTVNGQMQMCAMTCMLGKRLKKDPTQFNKTLKFIKNFGEELEVTFVYIAKEANPAVKKESAFVKHYCDKKEDFYF